MFEGAAYHIQLKHFLYTANPGPTLYLPDYADPYCIVRQKSELIVVVAQNPRSDNINFQQIWSTLISFTSVWSTLISNGEFLAYLINANF